MTTSGEAIYGREPIGISSAKIRKADGLPPIRVSLEIEIWYSGRNFSR
jgi:hypothetical protein